MPKRRLTPTEAFDLRQALHVATLDALMASRRWEPADLAFQGGASLHLAHGSPRYSEDLHFLVDASLNLLALADQLKDSGWKLGGLSPDDIEWAEVSKADERDWRAACAALALPAAALARMAVSSREHQPRAVDQRPMNSRR